MKEREDDHKDRFRRIGERRTEIKDKGSAMTRRFERTKRNSIDKKYKQQESQVSLARDHSRSRVELVAEKRNLLKEMNREQIEITEGRRKNKMLLMLQEEQIKKARHDDFKSKVDDIRNRHSISNLSRISQD